MARLFVNWGLNMIGNWLSVDARCFGPASRSNSAPRLWSIGLAGLMIGLVAIGCQKENAAGTAMPVPEVTVAPPVEKTVQHYEKFTGNTVADQQIEIRARVSGFLTKAPFKP